jgi:hypothetical protein
MKRSRSRRALIRRPSRRRTSGRPPLPGRWRSSAETVATSGDSPGWPTAAAAESASPRYSPDCAASQESRPRYLRRVPGKRRRPRRDGYAWRPAAPEDRPTTAPPEAAASPASRPARRCRRCDLRRTFVHGQFVMAKRRGVHGKAALFERSARGTPTVATGPCAVEQNDCLEADIESARLSFWCRGAVGASRAPARRSA